MSIDAKAYRTAVAVPLAKDKAGIDAVSAAIRGLNGGDGAKAIASLDLVHLFAVDQDAMAELGAHFEALKKVLNKLSNQLPPAALLKRLLEALDGAGVDVTSPTFWAAAAKAQADAQKARLESLIAAIATEHPLGVIAPDELQEAAAAAGLASLDDKTLHKAAEQAGLGVHRNFEVPALAIPPILEAALTHVEFRTVADLVAFPDSARNVVVIDTLTIDGTKVTPEAVAAAHHRSEAARDSGAVQAAQKALGLLKRDFTSPQALHEIMLAAIMRQAESLVKRGGPRTAHREALVALGVHPTDAARAIAQLTQGGQAAARPPSEEIAVALASGMLADARRMVDSLPQPEEDAEDRAKVALAVQAAEQRKQQAMAAYAAAVGKRDFSAAAQALAQAQQVDQGDPSLAQMAAALPPARPGTPVPRVEGREVLLSWPAVAEPDVRYVVSRSESGPLSVPTDGKAVGTQVSEPSLRDSSAPIARRCFYGVFTTRDGKTFSDASNAEVVVLPPLTDLSASSEVDQAVLSWTLPHEASGVRVEMRGNDGSTRSFGEVTANTLHVPSLKLGARYEFVATVHYQVEGRRLDSSPAGITVTPRGSLVPAAGFSVTVDDSSSEELRLVAAWQEVPGYPVEVWQLPVGAETRPGQRSSSSELAARGGTRMPLMPAGGSTPGHERRAFTAPRGIFAFVPLTVDGDTGILGQAVISGAAPSVRDPRAERFSDDIKLSWSWPEGDYVMEVAWTDSGTPRKARMTRAKYKSDGGFTISGSRGVADITVSTVVRTPGDEWVSPPVPIPYTAAGQKASYDLLVRKPAFRPMSVEVTVRSHDFGGSLPLRLVCAPGPRMPASADAGSLLLDELLTVQPGETKQLSCPLPKMPKPFWVRAFVAEGAPVTLLDPPDVTKMKVE